MPEVNPYRPKHVALGLIPNSLNVVREAVHFQLNRTISTPNMHCKLQKIEWPFFFEEDGLFFGMKRFQIALFSPADNLVVYVCNLADGWSSLYGNLVKATGFDAYFFRATLDLHAPHKVAEMIAWRAGDESRHVRALQDSVAWEFLDRGTPLWFENPLQYKKRKIADRLNQKTIVRYSASVGYAVDSVSSFDGECVHFWRTE